MEYDSSLEEGPDHNLGFGSYLNLTYIEDDDTSPINPSPDKPVPYLETKI